MSNARLEGSTTYVQPLDNGRTRYRVLIEFSNDYMPADEPGTDHPSMWGWVDLLDEPDARVLSWTEDPNPGWQRAVVEAQADRMMAERDELARRLTEVTGVEYVPADGTVWIFDEEAGDE